MSTLNLNNKPEYNRLWILVLIVFVILFGIALTGCVTDRAYKRILSECPIKDSVVIKDTIVYKRYDSTIYITSAPEVVILENPCDSNKLKKFDVKKKEHGILEEIKSDGKTIAFSCQDDSLKEIIRGLNIERTVSKEAFEERIKTITVCPETWIQTTYRWSAWFLYLCLVITILFFTGQHYLNRRI